MPKVAAKPIKQWWLWWLDFGGNGGWSKGSMVAGRLQS